MRMCKNYVRGWRTEGEGGGGVGERSPRAFPPPPRGKSRLPHGNAKLGLLGSFSNDDGNSNENVAYWPDLY